MPMGQLLDMHGQTVVRTNNQRQLGEELLFSLDRANDPQPYAAPSWRVVVDGYPAGSDPNGTEDTAIDPLDKRGTRLGSVQGQKIIEYLFVLAPPEAKKIPTGRRATAVKEEKRRRDRPRGSFCGTGAQIVFYVMENGLGG